MRIVLMLLAGALAGCASLGHDQAAINQQTSLGLTAKAPQEFFIDYDEKDSHGQISIDVEINEQGDIFLYGVINDKVKVKFHLDTGATMVSLSQKTIDRMWKAGAITETEYYSSRRGQASIASGASVETEQFLLDQLQIGAIKFPKVQASHIIGEGSDLLGMSFLRVLGEFTIDMQNQMLIAKPSDTYRPIPRASFFPTLL